MVQQFIHGTQYIDELVMVRVKDKGDMYIHQDANWNVIATTDLATNVVERYDYLPYGQFTVLQETSFGDRDGDGDVDSTDKGSPGIICVGTVSGACRVLDLDFDGGYDSSDATLFDALPQGIARHPGRLATATDQPFAHQGLLFEPEIGSYQNRARQYGPATRKFVQRDPLAILPCGGCGYQDGHSLYLYLNAQPSLALDPLGLNACTNGCGCSDGSVEFCGCMRTCRRIECSNELVTCIDPEVVIGAEALQCIGYCAPTLYLPGWVIAFRVCVAACAGTQGIAGMIVTGPCIELFQACGESANSAYDNCLDE